jgi:hypothetical protein
MGIAALNPSYISEDKPLMFFRKRVHTQFVQQCPVAFDIGVASGQQLITIKNGVRAG